MNGKLKTAAAAIALTLAVLAAAGTGGAESAKTVVGNVETEFAAGFSPRALPEKTPAPIVSSFRWNVRTRDGAHPPALKEFQVRSDRNAEFDVKGVPVCRLPGRGPRQGIATVRKECGSAIVGTGQIKGKAAFPGQEPVAFGGELLAVNGGVEEGVTKLIVHTFLAAPITAEIVTTMRVQKINKGRFGTELIATIPKIAGSYGSVTHFRLEFDKGISRATCPNGRLRTRGTAVFADGTRTSAGVVHLCAPKD